MEHTPITAGGSSTEQDEARGAQTCAVSHCAEPLVRCSRGGVLPLRELQSGRGVGAAAGDGEAAAGVTPPGGSQRACRSTCRQFREFSHPEVGVFISF